MRILTVFGTRPEAIKMAPVIRAARTAGLETFVCLTAQHRDMVDPMLEIFNIKPDFDLDLMRQNQSPLMIAARIFAELPRVVSATKPDWLLVQGDTTTAFSAAFTAYHNRVRIGHIEAGLRTQDKWRPFPEEMNRRLITSLADLHFAPTSSAAAALQNEGVPSQRIFLTGNTVVDALLAILNQPIHFADDRLNVINNPMLLVTAHRRENFGSHLEQICFAVRDLLFAFPRLQVVFPVHRNPQVVDTVHRILQGQPRIALTAPLPYPEFVHLMQRATLILSDSGGVQEEAPTVKTHVLVLREVTERPEAVESGWAELVGTSRGEIVKRASAWLEKPGAEAGPATGNPFGDGKASERIIQALRQSA